MTQPNEPVAERPAPLPEPQPRVRPRIVDQLIEIAVTAALAVALYFVIQTFVLQTFRVEGVSMEDSLEPDQHLLIDKLTPRFDDYSRGDIVVLHPPDEPDPDSVPFIKRVIGVAGDHVEVRDDGVWVNGMELDEAYVNPDYLTEPFQWKTFDVPQGEILVMGDHRDESLDSREFGSVPVGNVIGRAVLRFWPLDSLGIIQTPTYPDVPATPAE